MTDGAGYLPEDVAYFVRTSPYLVLAKPGGAVRFLTPRAEAAEECGAALRAYPALRIDPLEFFYTCLRSLGALDRGFFEALVRDHTWRGVVWGAWLAMLDPREEMVEPLRAARPGCPHNAWLVDCAVATIEGRPGPPEHRQVVELGARCRRSLEGVPRPVVSLRPEPTPAQIAWMAREREHLRELYAEEGADAVLRALPGTLVGLYAMDYPRWVRSRR